MVLVKNADGTYQKLTATTADGTHSFAATLAEGDSIIVALKGDVSGDGLVNNTDVIQAQAASLHKVELSGFKVYCAMVSGSTSVVNTDVIQIQAVSIHKASFKW